MVADTTSYPHVFSPIDIGTLRLDHRIVVPPHGVQVTPAYWLAKLDGGVSGSAVAP